MTARELAAVALTGAAALVRGGGCPECAELESLRRRAVDAARRAGVELAGVRADADSLRASRAWWEKRSGELYQETRTLAKQVAALNKALTDMQRRR